MDNLDEKIMEVMFKELSLWQLARRYDRIDDFLKGVGIEESSAALLISYLTVTLPSNEKLAYRETFYNNVKTELIKRGENVDYFLLGLEGKSRGNIN